MVDSWISAGWVKQFRDTNELNLAVHTLTHISTIGWKLILKVSSPPHDGYVGKRWVHFAKIVVLIMSLLTHSQRRGDYLVFCVGGVSNKGKS